jgi:RNA polymerase sigma-70 factor, ECF subfamily
MAKSSRAPCIPKVWISRIFHLFYTNFQVPVSNGWNERRNGGIYCQIVNEPELNGNGAWCQPLYNGKAAGLLLYGRALGLSHSEAEDVLQETFLVLMQLPQTPDDPEHYCVRAFRNRAINFRRNVWRRMAREWESVRWFEGGSGRDDAEVQAVRRLADLPAEQREVIVLKIWNRMTFEAIGRLLDVSPNTVAGRYRYGINKLRLSMKGDAYGRDEPIREPIAIMDAPSPFA